MEGKVVAITGAASGIGLETAKLLAGKGAKLSIADVNEDTLKKAKAAIAEASASGDEPLTSKCDVRDFSQVEGWLKQTVEKYGKLDGAANLAGIIGHNYGTYSIDEEDDDNWERIIGINLKVIRILLRS